jgi:hypothetical protein
VNCGLRNSTHKGYAFIMSPELAVYNAAMLPEHRSIADALAPLLIAGLPQASAKIWHRTAVWFIADNPVVGYASRKKGVQLLFWSGQSFGEAGLKAEGSFKAAEKHLQAAADIDPKDLTRWLAKAAEIQWDYKNIVKRKGRLEKIGTW